jgi:hypothetical protein
VILHALDNGLVIQAADGRRIWLRLAEVKEIDVRNALALVQL